jgi:tRNA threonylcarbamoyladenosine biosynthesis protein TsaE
MNALPCLSAQPKTSGCDLEVSLVDADATTAFGAWLADRIGAADTVLLSGPIGAGKTHLARAMIRHRLADPQAEVPSPTFTLVQVYDAPDVTIWHADLYRLNHPDEVVELGLIDAFDQHLCLVEWPDRLGRETPTDAIQIALADAGDARTLRVNLGKKHGIADQLRQDWGARDVPA